MSPPPPAINVARHWLLKTEPAGFSFADLLASPEQRTLWDGVRNFQARNFLREMAPGDEVLLYHSSVQPPGVVGLARVVGGPTPDPTQFDPASPYFDPKAAPDAPRWDAVTIQAVRGLPRLVSLAKLKGQPELQDLPLLRRGSRLSVVPVTETEFRVIVRLGSTEED